MTIEKLTESERRDLLELGARPVEAAKVLRIIAAQAERIDALEREMRRIGYGEEVIYCFDANVKPTHTSRVGDLSWDTRENRDRTFQFISETLERDRVAAVSSARAEHLQVHGLDPAEIEVDEMFNAFGAEEQEDEPECRAARHGSDSTCTCEDSRDE
jgi:hypothetical protein